MAVRRKARKKSEDLLGDVVEAARELKLDSDDLVVNFEKLKGLLAEYDKAIGRELDEDERIAAVLDELPPTSAFGELV